jgi:ubiquinone/menaquinone biosynthesis C-methylase UbiE
MCCKRFALLVAILAFLFSLLASQDTQKYEDVLVENRNEARLNRLQPPDQVMDAIGVKPGMTVAEIGAGKGRYVVQLAVRVGESGKVYAEDINAKFLKHLEKRCQRGGLRNVETILGDVTDPKLPEGKLDLIFVISSYHHFTDPVALLRNARPALKPDGILAIGEWLPWYDSDSPEYTTPEKMESQMKKAGYKLERIETFLEKNNMYIYIFRLNKS